MKFSIPKICKNCLNKDFLFYEQPCIGCDCNPHALVVFYKRKNYYKQSFATGGIVQCGIENVPAMLTTGEAVIQKSQQYIPIDLNSESLFNMDH